MTLKELYQQHPEWHDHVLVIATEYGNEYIDDNTVKLIEQDEVRLQYQPQATNTDEIKYRTQKTGVKLLVFTFYNE